MMIGFQLEENTESEVAVGTAVPEETGSPCHEGLFEFLLEHWLRFATVYGTYAAIRDLIGSIF